MAMQVFERPSWVIDKPSVVTIGVFDGLHRGHQALIERVLDKAHASQYLSGVLTFADHPLSVLAPPFAPKKLIYPDRKRQLLESFGLDFLVCLEFSKDFARTTPESFVEQILVRQTRVAAIVCGEDFCFGAEGKGTIATLRELGRQFNFEVEVLPAVVHKGIFVRSTMIRDLLYTGNVLLAAELLTRPYELRGIVVRGQGRGKTLGFPTANLKTSPAYVIPARGVYLCACFVPENLQIVPALVNIGFNPTFGSEHLSIEAHLVGFHGDLLGSDLYLFFLERIRDEMRFASVEELKRQIQRDCELGVARFESPALAPLRQSIERLVSASNTR